MRSLHALDHYGRIHTGVDAFILIWRHIPPWHLAATLVSLPGIKTGATALYRRFADWRFHRRTVCAIEPTGRDPAGRPSKELAEQ